MAYQLGLPVLILREKGVIEVGTLKKASWGSICPSLTLNNQSRNTFFLRNGTGLFASERAMYAPSLIEKAILLNFINE